ncbi:MAG: DUF2817 domain-containing protein [Ignavibacteriales bacterium]|nr:DUF2817 domain-containing protein [Ignavibacteriales bacterium]
MSRMNEIITRMINVPTVRRPFLALALCFAWSLVSIAQAQVQYVAPVERSGYQRVTSYDTLQAFLKEVGSTAVVHVEPLAKSKSGRTLAVAKVSSSRVFGEDAHKLRVLLFGQQHGDEHTGKEALTVLLARFASGDLNALLEKIDLLIVPQMNPDGSELYQRRTSDSVDLNRNHVLLTSPETRALHDLFYQWLPHVTLDVHEYGTMSRSWSDSGFVRIADTQLGMLTNANTSAEMRELQHKSIFPYIAGYMHGQGYFFQEYIVGSPSDRVRHSTTEINDGRQSFGILGTVSFIQEGIKWRTREDRLERRVKSQLASIRALLEYCSKNAEKITQIVSHERARLLTLAGQPIAVRMDHFTGKGELQIPVRIVATQHDTVWQVKPYHGEVRMQKSTLLPEKYIIEKKDSAIVQLLRRHHITVEEVKQESQVNVTAYMMDSTRRSEIEEEIQPLVSVSSHSMTKTLKPGDFIIPTKQLQSALLAIILEPESMWGLTKYEQFGYLLKEKQYPVLRTR